MGGRKTARRVPRNLFRFILLTILLALSIPGLARADAGDPDSSFDGNGMAIPAISGASSISVRAVATHSNGRIVCLGDYIHSDSGERDFVLFRLLPDGSLDTSFNSPAGYVIIDFGACDWAKDVAVQLDQRIVVVGVMEPGCGSDSDYQGIVARFLYNGTPDTTFGTNGKYIMSDMWETGWNAVAIDWLDQAVVAGFWGSDICLSRLTIGGAPDTSFGTSGLAFLAPASGDSSWAEDVAIDGSGRVVVAGTVRYSGINPDMVAARFTSGGVLDTTFGGGDGYWTDDISADSSDLAAGMVMDSAGHIYVGGYASGGGLAETSAVVVRLTSTGVMDSAFGMYGKAWELIYSEALHTTGIILDPWQQPVLAGYFGSTGGSTHYGDSWLIRFNTQGGHDYRFGGDGMLVVNNALTCNLQGLHLASGGRALSAGSIGVNPLVIRHRLFALDVGGCLGMLLNE